MFMVADANDDKLVYAGYKCMRMNMQGEKHERSNKRTFIWNGFIQGRKSNFCYKYADKFLKLTKLSKLPEHIFENLKISWQNSAAAALKSTAETDIDIVDYRKMA